MNDHLADASRTELPDGRDDLVVPVVVEEARVEKRLVDTGRGVRVHKSVHAETATIDQWLTSDQVAVERITIGKVVDEPPRVRHEGATLIVPVVVERLVTRVEHFLVEEIRVTRTHSVDRVERQVVLRRDEVTVERFDEAAESDESDERFDGPTAAPAPRDPTSDAARSDEVLDSFKEAAPTPPYPTPSTHQP